MVQRMLALSWSRRRRLVTIHLRDAVVPTPRPAWGHSSVGRALEWHSRGQGFDSPWLHQLSDLFYVIFLTEALDFCAAIELGKHGGSTGEQGAGLPAFIVPHHST